LGVVAVAVAVALRLGENEAAEDEGLAAAASACPSDPPQAESRAVAVSRAMVARRMVGDVPAPARLLSTDADPTARRRRSELE
jgi:hypothetical protein